MIENKFEGHICDTCKHARSTDSENELYCSIKEIFINIYNGSIECNYEESEGE